MKRRIGARWLLLFVAAVVVPAGALASVRSQVLYARGLVPFNRGFWEQAYRLFDEAVQADPQDASAVYYRGLTQARRGERGAAVSDLRKALALDPTLVHAPLDLGIAYLDDGRYADAKEWLEKAHAQSVDKLSAALFLGIALFRSGAPAEALPYLKEAKADPELRQAALYYGGLALLRSGYPEEGKAALADAVEEQPSSDMGQAAARYASGAPPATAEKVANSSWQNFSVATDVRMEYDSNVVIGSKDGKSGTDNQADGRPVLALAAGGTLLQSDYGDLSTRAGLSQSIHFTETDFDLTATQVRLDWTGLASWWTYGASAGYDFNALDYQGFSQDFVAGPWLAAYENEVTATQLYYGFRYRDFIRGPFDPFRDGFNNAVGLRQFYLLPDGISVLQGGYQFDAENPEDTGDSDPFIAAGADDFEYLGHQVDIQLASEVESETLGRFSGGIGYRFRFDGYTNDNSRSSAANRKKREDTANLFALSVGREILPAGEPFRMLVSLSLIADIHGSNLDEFQYDRVIGAIGLRAEF